MMQIPHICIIPTTLLVPPDLNSNVDAQETHRYMNLHTVVANLVCLLFVAGQLENSCLMLLETR